MARLRDVAHAAGVAESTVSHVLNGTKYVSAEISERVLASVRDLKYVGNAQARQLARGTSDFVGLIVSDIENPFLPAVIRSFEHSAQRAGYDVVMATTGYEHARAERALHTMIRNKVAAVAVMTSGIDGGLVRTLEAHAIRSVLLDAKETGALSSSVRLDYRSGALEAAQHLCDLGHQDIAIVAGPQKRASHAAYLASVRAACATTGLRIQLLEAMNTVDGGETAGTAFLTLPDRATAVMCGNDLTAIGFMRALHAAGLDVPGDISLIGTDDIAFSELTNPPLTTIHIPRALLGERAFAILHGGIRTNLTPHDEVMPTSLIVRGTTGPVRRGDATMHRA